VSNTFSAGPPSMGTRMSGRLVCTVIFLAHNIEEETTRRRA
jgi:hypothetical protein